MKNTVKTILLISVIAIYGCAVNQEKITETISSISLPFKGMETQFTEYLVSNSQGSEITTNTGSKISIPPFSFLDSNGDTINGEVTLKFREYHKSIEAFLSGIPMTYMAEGNKEYFESAGMFEIAGKFNNEDIQVNPAKKITVDLASDKTDDDFRFFKLKGNKENWTYMGENKPKLNLRKKIVTDSLNKIKKSLNKDYIIMNYMALADVYFNNNRTKIRGIKRNSFIKKFEQYGFNYLFTQNHSRVDIRGIGYPASMIVWENIGRKLSNKFLTSQSYTSKLTKKSNSIYQFQLINSKTKKVEFKTTLKVYMPIKQLISYSPKKWKEERESIMAEIIIEEDRIKLEAECFRAFEVNSFGIYNWDRLQKSPLAIQITPVFNFENELTDLNAVQVYYFTGTNNSVVKVDLGGQLILAPSQSAKLFAILPGNELAIYENHKYQKIDFERLKNTENEKVVFDFKNVGKVDSKQVIEKLLENQEEAIL
jgi:hypothetical protein